MIHLEWHQHAFIDENNTVINIAVFDESAHNHQLLEDIRIANNAKQVICCCQYGLPGIGWTWTESEFIEPRPFPSWTWDGENKKWISPIPKPDDGLWFWDEENQRWN